MIQEQQKILGIGDFHASRKAGDVIKTFALGSCISVIIFDLCTGSAGMIHVALPDSTINAKKARENPGHFADTGVKALVDLISRLGHNINRKNWTVKLAGGASVMKSNSIFNIGGRNLIAINKILGEYRLGIAAKDVGKNYSRTVEICVGTKKVIIKSPGRGTWEI